MSYRMGESRMDLQSNFISRIDSESILRDGAGQHLEQFFV